MNTFLGFFIYSTICYYVVACLCKQALHFIQIKRFLFVIHADNTFGDGVLSFLQGEDFFLDTVTTKSCGRP